MAFIPIDEIQIIENFPDWQSSENHSDQQINPCKKIGCTACCGAGMEVQTTMQEFSEFCGEEIQPEWVEYRQDLQSPTLDSPVSYFTPAKKYRFHPQTRNYQRDQPPLGAFRDGHTKLPPETRVRARFNEPCPKLTSNGDCGAYGTSGRFTACGNNFPFGGPGCDAVRTSHGLPSVSELGYSPQETKEEP